MRRFALLILTLPLLSACGPDRADEVWTSSVVVDGSPMRGVHGMAFGPDGRLYVTSVVGQQIYAVDVDTGAIEVVVDAPAGESDDVAFAPDGTMAWTAIVAGEVRARSPADPETTQVLARALPGINALNFARDGRLFASVPFGNDALFEIARDGSGPRLIRPNLGGLNGFELDDQDQIYGPLWIEAALARVDSATGAVTVLAETDGTPAAVNLDANGDVVFVAWDVGQVGRLDRATGEIETLAMVTPPIDNLAIGPDGSIYVSISNVNGIQKISADGDVQGFVTRSDLTAPGMMRFVEGQLLVSDAFGFRTLDPETGTVTQEPYRMSYGASTGLDQDGDLLALVNARFGTIQRIDRSTDAISLSRRDLDTPMDVLVAPNGDLIVTEFGAGRLVRLTGSDSEPVILAERLGGPVGLTWADRDRTEVFVTDALGGSLFRITLETGRTARITDRLFQPEGIAVLDAGRVVVAEVDANRISWVDTTTGEVTAIASRLNLGSIIARGRDPVHLPTGVAVDDDGVVYATIDGDNTILKIERQ